MEKSLEELVIKLRYYKIDLGSGAGIEIYLSQSKNFNYILNYCQTEIISLNEFFFAHKTDVINEADFIKNLISIYFDNS